MAKKTDLIPANHTGIQPATPRELFNHVVQSTADVAEEYSNIPGGRISAKKRNYSGGVQRVEMTHVPEVDKKYQHKQAIKEMKTDGLPMEDIARKLGISTSYAYQLARE